MSGGHARDEEVEEVINLSMTFKTNIVEWKEVGIRMRSVVVKGVDSLISKDLVKPNQA